MVRQFDKFYQKLVGGDKRWVSVIVPTYDRPEQLVECLSAIVAQDYPNIEIVVSDSGSISMELIIKEFRKNTRRPIKYIRFENKGEYTLPKARNLAVIKSIGEVLVFCDDRMVMETNAITEFEKQAKHKAWFWGVKDNYAKGFVENFSCIMREDFIAHGMCCERIDCYGGQTQELRHRFENSGMMFTAIETARANTKIKSGKGKHRQDIINAKYLLQEMYA
jgi:glycosyltransferase involved in cell wall biosynthesis